MPNYGDKNYATSPLPAPQKDEPLMDFCAAIKKVAEGAKVTRLEWDDKKWYCYMEEEHVRIHRPEGTKHVWDQTLGDIQGEDWVVV